MLWLQFFHTVGTSSATRSPFGLMKRPESERGVTKRIDWPAMLSMLPGQSLSISNCLRDTPKMTFARRCSFRRPPRASRPGPAGRISPAHTAGSDRPDYRRRKKNHQIPTATGRVTNSQTPWACAPPPPAIASNSRVKSISIKPRATLYTSATETFDLVCFVKATVVPRG